MSIDTAGDTVVVCASFADLALAPGVNVLDVGRAYVYARSGTVWTLQQTLTAADAQTGDTLGDRPSSAIVRGDTLVVGARNANSARDVRSDIGAAYAWTRTAGVWSLARRFNSSPGASAANDNFGNSVGMSGTSVVVASRNDSTGGVVNGGAAYVFTL